MRIKVFVQNEAGSDWKNDGERFLAGRTDPFGPNFAVEA
jgi:hypothetical protein